MDNRTIIDLLRSNIKDPDPDQDGSQFFPNYMKNYVPANFKTSSNYATNGQDLSLDISPIDYPSEAQLMLSTLRKGTPPSKFDSTAQDAIDDRRYVPLKPTRIDNFKDRLYNNDIPYGKNLYGLLFNNIGPKVTNLQKQLGYDDIGITQLSKDAGYYDIGN